MKLETVHLNTILAALRHYQASGFGELLNRQADINDIATDGGNHASLHDGGIDSLCEALNTGDLVLSNPKVEMSDWRENHALPAGLQGTSGTIDFGKCANGDIEIISPLGEKSVLSVEFDAGVPRIHIYPPDQDAPKEQSTDEFAVTVALLPGHVLAHDPRGNGYAMYAESQRPTPAPYFDGDSRIEEMQSQEEGDDLMPSASVGNSPAL
jgi:hypothetical protein